MIRPLSIIQPAMTRRHTKLRATTARIIPFDRIMLYLIAFLVFAVPLFILPGITEYGYGKSIVMLVAVSVLTILWGLDAWQRSEWGIRLPWLAFPVIGLFIASLFSLIHAASGLVVLQSLALLVCFAQFALIIAHVVRDPRDVDLLVAALLLSTLAAGIYGLLQYLGLARGASSSGGLNNVISFMGNRNYLGGFLTYVLIPSVILVIRPRRRIVRLSAIPLIVFGFAIALLLRQTATVVAMILAVLALLAGWLVFRPIEPLRARRVEWIALLLTLLVTFLVATPSGPLNSVVGLSDDGQSWIGRLWEHNSGGVRSWDWWVGLEMFADHPITGVGLGNYKLTFLQYKAEFLASPRGVAYDFYIARAAQAHNDYVQLLAELGALGTIALLGLLVLIPVSLWIRLRRTADEWRRFELLLLGAGMVTFLAHAFVSFPAHLPASALVAMTLVGLMFSRVYGEETTVELRLPRRMTRGAVIAVSIVCVAVSVIALRDLKANILMGRGMEQLQLGNNALAVSTLEHSARLDFCPRQTYSYLASAYLALGQSEEALRSLEVCMTRFTDESTYINYADLAANLGYLDEARDSATFLLATRPNRTLKSKASYLIALVDAREGDLAAAIDRLLQVAEEDPTFETSYILLGALYETQGLTQNAREAWETALAVIDSELEVARTELSTATEISITEYGTLRSSISRLEQERDMVIERLARLP